MAIKVDDSIYYAMGLGKILINLQSLEYCIRYFLLSLEKNIPPFSINPRSFKKGDRQPLNSFTNIDTLSPLIDKFNRRVKNRYPKYRLDKTLVDLRDAIVHGRISSSQPGLPVWLLNFKKDQHGIYVAVAEEITRGWLDHQLHRLFLESKKILAAGKAMGVNFS